MRTLDVGPPVDVSDASDLTPRGRWHKGRFLVKKSLQKAAKADGVHNDPSEHDTADTHTGEEARRRWHKGRLIVGAARKFQQAGADGAARRASGESVEQKLADDLAKVLVGKAINTALKKEEVPAVAPVAQPAEDARRRWKRGRLVVTAARKFQQAGADATSSSVDRYTV